MKKVLSGLIAVIMVFSFMPVLAEVTLEGSGTEESPYLIGTEADLIAFRGKVNSGETTAYATLTADIALTGVWTPIGTLTNKYAGIFDGNGKTITNFKGSGNIWGMFAYTDGGEIKSLTLKTSSDEAIGIGHQAALFVAMASNNTKISRCAGYGDISGWGHIGGITYDGACIVENCYYVGDISGAHNVSGMGMGAVATNCFVYGNIKATTSAFKVANGSGTDASKNFYLSVEGVNTVGYGTQVAEEAFKSGELTCLLNSGSETDVFGQDLSENGDITPVFFKSGNRVSKIKGEYVNVADDWVPPALNGGGTEDSPYLINNKEVLELFRDAVNKGQTNICARLTADIDLENDRWTPIGTSDKKYSGTFDGNGYEISNMTGSGTAWGLFAYTDGGAIKNLTISTGSEEVTEIGHQSALFVAVASNDTKITNCAGYGDISGYGYIGGITYDGACIVENCYYVGDITGAHMVSAMGNGAAATNCFIYGTVKATTNSNKISNKSATNCYYLNAEGANKVGYGTQKSENAFKNGEVAYLLRETFGQLLGKDEHPVWKTEYNVVEAVLNGYANTYAVPAVGKVEFVRADGNVMNTDSVSMYTDEIIIHFTSEMNEVSVTDAIELEGVTFTGNLSDNGTDYILTVTDGTIPWGDYELRIKASATNTLGNNLAKECLVEFTVTDGTEAIVTSANVQNGTSLETIKNGDTVNLTITGYNPRKLKQTMTVLLVGYKTVNGIKEMTASAVKPVEILENNAVEINEIVTIQPSLFADAEEVKLFVWGYPVQSRLTSAISFK